jgi:hypothetical protein
MSDNIYNHFKISKRIFKEPKIEGSGLKDFFKIKKQYNNVSSKTLKKYGSQTIKSIKVVRTPIFTFLKPVFKKLLNEDKAYHLAMHATLQSNVVVSIEKQEQINIKPNPTLSKDSEVEDIGLNNEVISLNQMLEATEKYMGDKYFLYNAYDNNCQDYIMAILKANQLGNDGDVKFIKQLTTNMEGELILRSALNHITDLGTRVQQVIGAGHCLYCEGSGFQTTNRPIDYYSDFIKENIDKYH